EAKTTRGWLATMGLFTLGLVLPMAAVGALVGGLGFGLRELFTENAKVIAVSLYSAVGVFALLYALGEFDLLRLPSLTTSAVPGFISKLSHYRRSFMLGLVIGGGLGIGCPFPTYHALLGWAAAVGSVWYGAALLSVNAIGRVLPLFVIGLLFFSGMRPQTVTHWLAQKRQTVKLVNGIGLTILGAFLLIFWGIIVGLGVGS
ncbi:MAG: cytochrome c biogenesis protein CcdA, partial [Candidatus Bipolaricaulia bacterium]